jgi:hypothetical protein
MASKTDDADKTRSRDTDESLDFGKSYVFGAEGKALERHVAIAGAIGFFLFGYDQGVLSVSSIGPLPSHVLMSDFTKGLNVPTSFYVSSTMHHLASWAL